MYSCDVTFGVLEGSVLSGLPMMHLMHQERRMKRKAKQGRQTITRVQCWNPSISDVNENGYGTI